MVADSGAAASWSFQVEVGQPQQLPMRRSWKKMRGVSAAEVPEFGAARPPSSDLRIKPGYETCPNSEAERPVEVGLDVGMTLRNARRGAVGDALQEGVLSRGPRPSWHRFRLLCHC